MHVDDRLATVLRQTAGGKAIARIQYRQLVDLLGTLPPDAGGPQIDAAYLKLGELGAAIPPGERALILREPVVRLRAPRLVAQLTEGEPLVAAAAIARAELDEAQWLDLVPALPVRARGLLRHRRALPDRVRVLLARLGIHDRALPPGKSVEAAPAAQEPAPPVSPSARIGATILPLRPRIEAPANEPAPSDGIRAIVRRIEEFRRHRQEADTAAQAADAPRLPFGETEPDPHLAPITVADFTAGADGVIDWADPVAAPMLVGLPLAAREAWPGRSNLAEALRSRIPVRGAMLRIAGADAIRGDWRIDAVPRFAADGRFAGYRGRMRRAPARQSDLREQGAADQMRQLLHELRNPVAGIQGAAETMQQAVFGPISHEYRACAATILGDAARILAAFDELDRLVKLGAGAIALREGSCDLAAVTSRIVGQLEPWTSQRSSGFSVEADDGPLLVEMRGDEAERMLWRLLASLVGIALPGERLRLRLRRRDDRVRLTVRLPATLAARSDEELLSAVTEDRSQSVSAGMFGIGFALRLAMAEAHGAGGALSRRGDRLRLELPGLTRAGAGHSDQDTLTASMARESGHT